MTAQGAASAAYIVAALLFILALAGLSRHETARAGNTFGIAGMAIALVATLVLAISGGFTALQVGLLIGAVAFALVAAVSPASFLGHFTVFALAVVIGYYVIGNVHHALHTPLMSVTNAISGIIVVGALLQLGAAGSIGGTKGVVIMVLGFVAALLASINIFGGFTVTRRMLTMFRKG